MSDIEIEIDGKKLQAKPNAMVIQVADEAGIYIPRFCYHKHLSIAANCRMCLVEVEKSPKTLPACATPVMPGMKVFTKSPKALAAQKAVMEFLLINHPLDCPICDQGGECELQDLSLGFGSADSFYTEGKRAVFDQDIGPLIETEMTRCIQCTRCVRFGAEVAGMRELGATGRGEHMEIGTYVEHAMKSEVSGNVIDICPVGALTSKPFRFTARAWELEQRPTIAAHDCVGTNLNAHMRTGKVMRMVPRENMNINETWISDRDRFSYEGLYHADRIGKPRIKHKGVWQETDWQTALEFAVHGVQRVIAEHGVDEFAALASPNATVEEFYLLQKLMRGLGSPHIDHRLRQVDVLDQDNFAGFPGFALTFAEVEQCDTIFLVGSNIQKEAPSAFLRLRKASRNGATIMALNAMDYTFSFDVAAKQIVAADEMAAVLAGIAKELGIDGVPAVAADPFHVLAANQLLAGKKTCFILGHVALNAVDASLLRSLSLRIAKRIGATVNLLTEGANSAGAWLAGAVPHRGTAQATLAKTGQHAHALLQDARKAYVLLNVEPDLDVADPVAANVALQKADFVVSLSLFNNPVLEQHADVILPMVPFTETSGSYINVTGEWQRFNGVATPFEEARPAWKVLRVLGNLFHLAGFDHTSTEEVHDEIKNLVSNTLPGTMTDTPVNIVKLTAPDESDLYRLGGIPLYAVDSLVRRAKSLQAAQPILEGNVASVWIHPTAGERLGMQQGAFVTVKQKNGHVRLPVTFDERLPLRGVFIAGGIAETSGLSELFGSVVIEV
jgi:NADH-quinone oxidoreductase subunit G